MVTMHAMRRLAPLLAGLTALAAPLAAQEEDVDDGRALHWREIAVVARLDEEGRLHVRERQAMVFDGAWNGGERNFDVRLGQELELRGLTRIDPATGARTPLQRGDLEEVDEYSWGGGDRLRWRSRLPSDPPFRNQEIVYEIDYVLSPVLGPTGGDGYRLRHDFAFRDRVGVIERFDVELTLDPVWSSDVGPVIREGADRLPPGRGYVINLALRYAGAGTLEAVAAAPPAWVRGLTAGGALLVPLLAFLGLRKRGRELDAVAPITPPDEIDEEWLRAHIFGYPAELVGTAWDRAVGEAEVAALLARLVEEGKLTSRVDTDDEDEPVLHLHRVAPLHDFAEHERALLEGLFFGGGDDTNTAAIRKHYEEKGFDPASKISKTLMESLRALPGEGRARRSWAAPALLMLGGAALLVLLPGRPGRAPVVVIGLVVAVVAALLSLGFAATLARRVTHRTGPAVGVVLPLLLAAALLALFAAGGFEGGEGLVVYRPGAPLLLSMLVVLAGLGWLAFALTKPSESEERIGFRRRLVSAREFFERELERPDPRLRDGWFPYLLAFGLGSHVDRWFRSFGGREDRRAAPMVVATGAPSGG
ncbi:MAG TPA: hypothetical protein VFZ18_09000, partial [Longimicrobiaceae bacterium]